MPTPKINLTDEAEVHIPCEHCSDLVHEDEAYHDESGAYHQGCWDLLWADEVAHSDFVRCVK